MLKQKKFSHTKCKLRDQMSTKILILKMTLCTEIIHILENMIDVYCQRHSGMCFLPQCDPEYVTIHLYSWLCDYDCMVWTTPKPWFGPHKYYLIYMQVFSLQPSPKRVFMQCWFSNVCISFTFPSYRFSRSKVIWLLFNLPCQSHTK